MGVVRVSRHQKLTPHDISLTMLFLLLLFLGAAAAEENKTQPHYYTANGFPQTSLLQYGLFRFPAAAYQGTTNLGLGFQDSDRESIIYFWGLTQFYSSL